MAEFLIELGIVIPHTLKNLSPMRSASCLDQKTQYHRWHIMISYHHKHSTKGAFTLSPQTNMVKSQALTFHSQPSVISLFPLLNAPLLLSAPSRFSRPSRPTSSFVGLTPTRFFFSSPSSNSASLLLGTFVCLDYCFGSSLIGEGLRVYSVFGFEAIFVLRISSA
jgi:hypothetical protein